MNSSEIRQSFLDFFAERGHTIVPSSSLMPDSPGLLFTNAGMNQFVPIFLGDRVPDVSKWAGARPGLDTRAADTQKCIRAGGKHNDLEDVGFDTYHHTLFEMLGNWSFGDYFKKESLEWGWDLLTRVWGMPPRRLFATVYSPNREKGDPSEFDQEAFAIWKGIFERAGLDPNIHIVYGNKKDNFWMMGDTGPCGPCSEIHFNLLPGDDENTGRQLVNQGSSRCIEIWNHVFIQFNANADGTFSALSAKHVDTGMGFERVAGIAATTNNFCDFSSEPSNYNADVFQPLFRAISSLSGKEYRGTVPRKREGLTEQENTDVAFRVLADHARTLACAIADGILPGNDGRNYVVRRILRRAILYGKKLGLTPGFFEQLVAPVVASLGPVFPELAQQQDVICRVIRGEEESFGRTLERGLEEFRQAIERAPVASNPGQPAVFSGEVAFRLYDTYGFPLDMTQLLAAERIQKVDTEKFAALMAEQRERGRAAIRREIVVAATETGRESVAATQFVGYDRTSAKAVLLDKITNGDETFLVFDQTPFYAEMGGQAGDSGTALIDGQLVHIVDCVKDKGGRHLHQLAGKSPIISPLGSTAELLVDAGRRRAISRHHSAAHLINWGLRKILGTHVRQAGTSKTPERMRFDFSHFEAVTHAQLLELEELVNTRVIENAPVAIYETEFDKKPEGTLAFFGEKYGRLVRVVDIGGYSRELCGGTHVVATGEIGLIKIVAEMAVAAGTRRIEAVAGKPALDLVARREAALAAVSAHLSAGAQDVVPKLESLLNHQKDLEKQLKAFQQKATAAAALELVAQASSRDGLKFVSAVVPVDTPETLRALGPQILGRLGEGVVVLGAIFEGKASVAAFSSPGAIKQGHQAGKIIAEICGQLGGKGGGKPDFAMGGGKDAAKLADVLNSRR